MEEKMEKSANKIHYSSPMKGRYFNLKVVKLNPLQFIMILSWKQQLTNQMKSAETNKVFCLHL